MRMLRTLLIGSTHRGDSIRELSKATFRLRAFVVVIVAAYFVTHTTAVVAVNVPSEEQSHDQLDQCIALLPSIGALAYWKCARLEFLSKSGGSEIAVKFVSEGDKAAIALKDGRISEAQFIEFLTGLMEIVTGKR